VRACQSCSVMRGLPGSELLLQFAALRFIDWQSAPRSARHLCRKGLCSTIPNRKVWKLKYPPPNVHTRMPSFACAGRCFACGLEQSGETELADALGFVPDPDCSDRNGLKAMTAGRPKSSNAIGTEVVELRNVLVMSIETLLKRVVANPLSLTRLREVPATRRLTRTGMPETAKCLRNRLGLGAGWSFLVRS
jgi:hypothetical protein